MLCMMGSGCLRSFSGQFPGCHALSRFSAGSEPSASPGNDELEIGWLKYPRNLFQNLNFRWIWPIFLLRRVARPAGDRTGQQKIVEMPFGLKSKLKRKGKRDPDTNSRQWPRFSPAEVPSLKSISSNAGMEMKVVNVSRGGALLETEVRLPPGTGIMLKVVTVEGVIQIAGHVLRSSVSSLKGIPKYQSAVAFESPLHILDDLTEESICVPQRSRAEGAASGELSSEGEQTLSEPVHCRDSKACGPILSVSACEAQDTALYEMLKLNDW